MDSLTLPDFLKTEENLDGFLRSFQSGTFPKKEWTHGAHVVLAASVLWAEPVRIALPLIRDGIRCYNVAQGTANTANSGYHESLTRLWVGVVAAFLASLPADSSRLEAAVAAHRQFSRAGGMFRCWYSFDVIQSEEARAAWVPPDTPPAVIF